jgi:hypothetical protein
VIEMYLGTFSGGWAIDGLTQAWSAHTEPSLALEHWAREIEEKRAGRWRKASVALWLSGGLARPFLCGPVAGLTNWAEAEAVAAAAAAEATGFDGPCRVRLEGWPGDAAALCTAIQVSLAQAIDEVARARRVVWCSIRPRWATLLDAALTERPSMRLLAFAEEDAFTLLGGSSPRSLGAPAAGFELAATYAPAPSADRTTALWHRTMLSRDVQSDDAGLARLETPALGAGLQAADDAPRRSRWPGAVRQSGTAGS